MNEEFFQNIPNNKGFLEISKNKYAAFLLYHNDLIVERIKGTLNRVI